MKKYLIIINNSLQEYFTFRLNFLLWRIRVIVSVLITYFLWLSVYQSENTFFGYSKSHMLTYVLVSLFINGIVFSTQTFQIATEINTGSLSNFLIRPVNYFYYNFARDIADKIVNGFFSTLEFILLIFILNPPIILVKNPLNLIIFFLFILCASILYFELNVILSFIGFWSHDTWAPRFLFFILITFLAGNYFPLDILPTQIYNILKFLPFSYLLYYPLTIYLGQLKPEIIFNFVVVIIWIIILNLIVKSLWKKGLKVYTAEGQ